MKDMIFLIIKGNGLTKMIDVSLWSLKKTSKTAICYNNLGYDCKIKRQAGF